MRLFQRILLVVGLIMLAGCGPVTDPDDVTPAVYVETAEADPEVAAVFGQEAVDEAVAELTAFAVAEAFPPALLDPEQQEFSSEELAEDHFTERLTPEAAQGWQTLVDAALGGDPQAKDAVRTIRFYDVEEPWTLPGDDPVVVSQQITNVQVDVDATGGAGQELLEITFDHDATLAFLDAGEPVSLEVEKTMTYRLSPAPADERSSWLIASFEGDFELTEGQ